MGTLQCFQNELITARNELKNIRQELRKLKVLYEKDVIFLKNHLDSSDKTHKKSRFTEEKVCPKNIFSMNPIGVIESCFKLKNGIPRQASLCPPTKACLRIDKTVFSNPEHSLVGLEEFSHLWILFVFHKNGEFKTQKAKVHPPRLNGSAVGVFSTRSPHRPNAIGLSLTKLEKIEGDVLFLSGVDLLDGTPVLDVKPYIPSYDAPSLELKSNSMENQFKDKMMEENPTGLRLHCEQSLPQNCDREIRLDCNIKPKDNVSWDSTFSLNENSSSETKYMENRKGFDIANHLNPSKCSPEISISNSNNCNYSHNKSSYCKLNDVATDDSTIDNENLFEQQFNQTIKDKDCIKTPSWLCSPSTSYLHVAFTNRAQNDIKKFHNISENHEKCNFCLDFLTDSQDAEMSISRVLQNDPRSIYRRNKCADRLYYFTLDSMHITCWFDDNISLAEILRVQPVNKSLASNEVMDIM